MDAKLALELGVMLTEILMNSVKHGMSDDGTSAVGVTLEEDDGMWASSSPTAAPVFLPVSIPEGARAWECGS